MAQIDRSLPIPALALARRRMLEVNRVLHNNPSAATRPKWERLQVALQKEADRRPDEDGDVMV